ncbi:methyltransferase domain-containing protein [Paenibacillus aceris]|uniref:SAM-dependent methyltransferase/FtsZ-binding cell division protein ZapB n=1 Tax=Paenibacillus aceris TaxID=869555 RepID=A0ABS4I2R9_9BACL|nr:methyltransferase domain-containing protein [Paenibacillus aceris]MBP1965208.1 SAM-dependent methyltransferase/FtsZ-binding cell division protein ZapB [Paenibacillus aceris]NHW33185.1 sulfotransferase family 2 domain-containing protein [Paenibacillus aceris]
MYNNEKTKYFYLHMPKCAGTSLRIFLQEHFGRNIYFTGTEQVSDFSQEMWEEVSFIGGYLTPNFKEIYGEYTEIIEFTILRDPIKRYISHYNYYKEMFSLPYFTERFRNIGSFEGYERDVIEYQKDIYENITSKSFEEFIDYENFRAETDNIFARMLMEKNKYPQNFGSSKTMNKSNFIDMEIIYKRLDDMAFVGIQEDMNTTLKFTCDLLGIPEHKPKKESITQKNYISIDDLSPDILDKIQSRLELDYQIYEYGKKLFYMKKEQVIGDKTLKKHYSKNGSKIDLEVIDLLKNKKERSAIFKRENIVHKTIIDKNSRILEIGPLNRPLITREEFPNSFYADIRSTEDIKKLYTSNDYLKLTGIYIDPNTIIDIDYMLTDSYEETFKDEEKFDFIIASHVLEHVPDLIFFLRDASSALKENGKIIILYPDKRYCFDHFREPASFRDAYDVFVRGTKETSRMVLDFYNTVIAENNAEVFWDSSEMQKLLPKNNTDDAITAYNKALNGEKPDDVHFWPFTDGGFLRFLYDCIRAKLIPYCCIDYCPTFEGTQEFFVVLERNDEILADNINELNWLSLLIASSETDYFNSNHINMRNQINSLNQSEAELNYRINELKQYSSSLENELNLLRENNDNLQNDINILRENNDNLQNDINILRENNDNLQNDLNILRENNDNLQNELNLLRQNNDNLHNEINLVRQNNTNQQNVIKSLQEKNDTFEYSTIWRMTKPLRILLDSIKKIIR